MGSIQKIAILFDSFVLGGGAEKLVLELASLLSADVYTSGYDKELYKEWKKNARIIDIGNFFVWRFPRLGFVESAIRFAFFRPRQKYDLYIFSGFFSIFAAWRLKPNVWYCCQPNRTIYDLKEFHKKNSAFFGKLFIETYSFFWKPLDQWVVKKHLQKIICISKAVQRRIKEYYGLESKVVYPSIDSKKYFLGGFGNYFFFAGRLIPEKRVELLLEAFSKTPEKKLVIAGAGPLEGMIKGYSSKFENIVFEGRVSDKRLRELVANCLATIYLPVQEDFGMFPLEGNAAGKPCIAAKEGGCLETVAEGKNGFLIKPTEEELIKAVRAFSSKKAEKMKLDCVSAAKEFGEKRFEVEWKTLLKEPLAEGNGKNA